MIDTNGNISVKALDADPSTLGTGSKSLTRPALEVRGVWTGYGQSPALEDITFQVDTGEVLGVIGPNGSGKTTLMKTILGLMRPWQGEVSVLGKPAHSQRVLVGYMPQLEEVDWDFPVTVGDVALMGRYARRGPFRRTTKSDREAASQALQQAGMYELRNNLIGELSGGQRRRALLARALANQPRLLLMDEPMAGLDATAQHRLLDLLDDLRAQSTTIVLSTHDLSCVSAYCRFAACLNRKLIAFGPPSQVLNEEVLSQTFGSHLLMVHLDGQAYAYQHHNHDNGPEGPSQHSEA